jgi:predicted Zn-dependent protease
MKKFITLIVFVIIGYSLGLSQKKSTNHDISCYDGNGFSSTQRNIEENFLSSTSVTVDEELEIGKAVYDEMGNEHKIRTSGDDYDKVNNIMNRLITQIHKFNNPSKNDNYGKYKQYYKIYIIESDEINAFTAGARIFITTGIYTFCKNDSELAAIIGHEISHNELGHIGKHVKRQKGAQILGGFGGLAYMVGNILTTPFGQIDEGHCDLFGMDLSKSADFQPCKTIDLWERMAEQSGEKTFLNLFSSHPYSGDRAACARNHLEKNYSQKCNR